MDRQAEKFVTLRALTESGGSLASEEQFRRLVNRYEWASTQCRNRDVVEVACGSGFGLGILADVAKSLLAGDVVPASVAAASAHFGDRVRVECFAAEQMPVRDQSVDVVIIFEALYYLPSASAFFIEARRVLRDNGVLLIATANKDLPDFLPSPAATRYLGVEELAIELRSSGFAVQFWGDVDTRAVSWRQRLLRPLKKVARAFNLVPQTLAGREMLKRLFFGRLVPLPDEIKPEHFSGFSPVSISAGEPDLRHKVLLCRATRDVSGHSSPMSER